MIAYIKIFNQVNRANQRHLRVIELLATDFVRTNTQYAIRNTQNVIRNMPIRNTRLACWAKR